MVYRTDFKARVVEGNKGLETGADPGFQKRGVC